jgi:hypothetical protein
MSATFKGNFRLGDFYNCPDITVEVIGNHSSRLQSTYGLFSLLLIRTWPSFGGSPELLKLHDRLLEHISDQ